MGWLGGPLGAFQDNPATFMSRLLQGSMFVIYGAVYLSATSNVAKQNIIFTGSVLQQQYTEYEVCSNCKFLSFCSNIFRNLFCF